MNNPPAFPTGIITDGKGKIIGGSNGMTLRDYMAAKAMQGMMAEVHDPNCEYIAQTAYKMADAMLKERGE
jgi:hypothetical protein